MKLLDSCIEFFDIVSRGDYGEIEGFDTGKGLCRNLEYFLRDVNDIPIDGIPLMGVLFEFNVSFRDWPYFSGCYVYPIPAALASRPSAYTAKLAFSNAAHYYLGDYGEARKDFAGWLLDELIAYKEEFYV